MIQRPIVLVAFVASLSSAPTLAEKTFSNGYYKIGYPDDWQYQKIEQANGNSLDAFMAPDYKKAIAYCHASQSKINSELTPKIAGLNAAKMRDFVLQADSKELFFSSYSNLQQSQGFRLIHINQTLVDTSFPALKADFVFREPDGFSFRARSHLIFWNKAIISIWCQTAAQITSDADDAFQKYLPEFIKFISKVKIQDK
jgi:hypothetical protein